MSAVAPVPPCFRNGTDILFRYGELKHLLPMIKKGKVRVSPAHCYKTIEEDQARTDDELNKHSFLPKAYYKMTTLDGKDVTLRGDIRQTVSSYDYFFLSTACDWDTSLFQSFKADACLIIRNQEELMLRLKAASKSKLAGWELFELPVMYFDPYENPFKGRVFDAATCKDFRFAYQQEVRLIWISKEVHAPEHVFLDAGPLGDIAEIYLPDGNRL